MKRRTKLIQEGEFVVAVSVELVEPAPGWGSCLSLHDAEKLDETRAALRAGDLKRAGQHGQLYRLTPLSA